jgi:hypothetical protein
MRVPFALPLPILTLPLATLSFSTLSLTAVGAAFALPARAEEPAESDLEKQLKEQVKKVLELMKRNEDALLKASTQGAKDAPRGPDVPVPPPGSQASGAGGAAEQGGGGQGGSGQGGGGQGSAGQGSGGQAGNGGEDAKRALDELLKALQQEGGAIPGEIENLIKMMPT